MDYDTGDLKPEAYQDPARRRFNERWNDPVEREILYREMIDHQRQAHPAAQEQVGGKQYDGATPYDGYLAWREDLASHDRWSRETLGEPPPTDTQIGRSSDQEYEQWLQGDRALRLTPGRFTNLRASMDPFTASELEQAMRRQRETR